MTPSLEGRLTKTKEATSLLEVRPTPLDINPVFQFLGEEKNASSSHFRFYASSVENSGQVTFEDSYIYEARA